MKRVWHGAVAGYLLGHAAVSGNWAAFAILAVIIAGVAIEEIVAVKTQSLTS